MKRKNSSKRLTHDELKAVGRRLLLDRGFNTSEIKEEYDIEVANKKHYRIDIAAVREGKIIVAIECGQLKHEKATVVSEIADELIHIPYHFKMTDNMNLDFIALKEENKRLKQILEQKEMEKRMGFLKKKEDTDYIYAKAGSERKKIELPQIFKTLSNIEKQAREKQPESLTKLDELTEKVEKSPLPEFYTVVNRLIAEIAKERGENPEDFKETLLAKIRTEKGMIVC